MNKKIIVAFCFLLILAIRVASAQNYIISTIAGNGTTGALSDGKPAIDGSLNAPWGIAVDKAGNVYIADANSSTVEKIDTNGILSTVAGPGSCFGCVGVGDNGLAKYARLSSPTSIAVDTAGNLYIADWGDLRIRKVDKNGIITTVAGKGVYGFSGDGGIADSAEMEEPYGVAVDNSGNVYFADAFNNRVRKVNTQGIITTVAGNGNQNYSGDGGPAVNATLSTPVGVGVDTAGNLYIADGNNSVIRKVNKAGIITTVAGTGARAFSGDGGQATSAALNHPWEVAVDDSGNIYIPDASNQRIRKVYTNGIIQTIAGTGAQAFSGDGGPAVNAAIFGPFGIALDHKGNVFFADENNERVRKLSPCSSTLSFKPSSPHVCKGLGINLSLDALNSYTWLPATGLNTTNGYMIVAGPSVTTTYTINGTSCAASGTLVVTVDTFPIIKVNPISETVCEGQNIQLSASGGITYKWSPSKDLNQATGSFVTATGGFNTTYSVIGSNGFCSTKDSIVLTIGNSFKPGTISSPSSSLSDSICSGTPEKLTLSSSRGSIQWQSSDSLGHFKNIAGATDTFYSFAGTVTTSFRVVVSNGTCGDTSISYPVSVVPDPVVTFNSFKQGFQVIFSSSAGSGITRYSWDFGDNSTSSDPGPSHLYAKDSTYYVCLTVYNGFSCSYTTCNYVSIGASGIDNLTQQVDWNIFPNPTDGQLMIEMNTPLAESNNLSITDVLGRTVYTQKLSGKKSLVNLSPLSSGTYFVHLRFGNVNEVKKLVKN